MPENQTNSIWTGNLINADDGFHMASGNIKILQILDGSQVLRFENLDVTNGTELYVYLATDTDAKDFVSLENSKVTWEIRTIQFLIILTLKNIIQY